MSSMWTPSAEADKRAKEVFDQLDSSLSRAIEQTPNGQPNRFVLYSKSFFDLQAFILTCKGLPRNSGEFEHDAPERTFRRLTEIDPYIYTRTKETVCAIGQICTDFNNNHLAKLFTLGNTAIKYSETAKKLRTGQEEMSLDYQVRVLLDPKYRLGRNRDGEYMEASETAGLTLRTLSEAARSAKTELSRILQDIQNFKNNISKFDVDFKYLTKQYKDGPAENQNGKTTPYLEYLNSDLANRIRNFEKAIKEVNEQNDGWVDPKGVSVGLTVRWPLGYIVTSEKAVQASTFRDSYESLISQERQVRQSDEDAAKIFLLVTRILAQSDNVSGKTTKVIAAVQELITLFAEQESCYEKIADFVRDSSEDTDLQSANQRKAHIEERLRLAIAKLKELKEVAKAFNRGVTKEFR